MKMSSSGGKEEEQWKEQEDALEKKEQWEERRKFSYTSSNSGSQKTQYSAVQASAVPEDTTVVRLLPDKEQG